MQLWQGAQCKVLNLDKNSLLVGGRADTLAYVWVRRVKQDLLCLFFFPKQFSTSRITGWRGKDLYGVCTNTVRL